MHRSTCWTLEEDLRHRGTGGVPAQPGGTREGRGGRTGGDGMGPVTWGWMGGGEVPTLGGPTHGGGIGRDRRGPLGDQHP